MTTERFLLGRRRHELSAVESARLEAAVGTVELCEPRQELVRHGEPVMDAMLLVDGFICRYMDGLDGDRQLVALHVPGDFVDLHGYPLRTLDHDVEALDACRVARFSHASIEKLVIELPNLGKLLWFSTMLDAAMHREWIFRLGRLGAQGRIAHFLCEVERRLRMVGLSDGRAFDLPMQQTDLASACAITPVHVSRVLRELREAGVVAFASGRVLIGNLSRLQAIAEFDDGYLYPA